MSSARLAGHPGVAHGARSLTHFEVRSLTCSFAPSAGLTSLAEMRYVEGTLVEA